MSQSAPPPQPPQSGPLGANPYAQQAPAPVPGAPYPPQPGAFAAPPAPPAPVRSNLVLGLVAALVAAVVAGALYGVIAGATKHEIGYAAVGVGFVIGLAAGKAGGRNPALPVLSAVLALGAVYLGQLVGDAIIIANHFDVSFNEIFFKHFSGVQEVWKKDSDPLTFLFLAIGAAAAFSGSRKAAQ
ncbi:hypothetical protein GCM10010260_15680 [Streptomyces filipinensis]|uniref:Uncharacterized protein n=1 Tax=Streptomyces filipinensis TaxID=66887 RepID=A0A918M9B6_9ACTN|nr:hypothetical protein [Streptomyces filipinensis]GGU83786.1 hypothetical protein GCM10010260_15680 [Streptomyces filipinensis]